MRKALIALLAVAVLTPGFALAQAPASPAGGPHIGFGWHNQVHVVYRHCQKYSSPLYETKGHLFWKHKIAVGDALSDPNSPASMACKADPSTIFYEGTGLNASTLGGQDAMYKMAFDNAAAPTQCKYIALSDDADPTTNSTCAASSTTCTVAGEKTGTTGLQRAVNTAFTRVTSAQYTSYKEFTYDGSAGSISLKGAALVNSVTAGQGSICFVYNFSPAPGAITTNGDKVQVTWTINASMT